MPTADPPNGDTPYDVLGVSETDSLETIRRRSQELLERYAEKRANARKNDDDRQFRRALDAIETIDDAWSWIRENHEPPEHDGPASIEVLTDDPRVGAPVEIRVTGPDGPVETLVQVLGETDGDGAKSTDSDGRASFTLGKRDTAQFTVETADGYDDATAVVEVAPKRVDLSVDAPAAAEVGEAVTISAEGDGSPEPGVEISSGSTDLGETGSGGSVTHTFDATGERRIVGAKPDDDVAVYDGCETTLEVTPETVDLDVSVEESNLAYGDRMTAHVREAEGREPVGGATVSVGGVSRTTNGEGVATFDVPEVGTLTVTAEKPASGERTFGRARTRVTANKRRRDLEIGDVTGRRMENTELTVTVRDGGRSRLPGATVTTDWGHETSTDSDGEATLAVDDHGRLEIEASKETAVEAFGTDTRVVSVEAFTREIDVEISESLPDPGEEITVTVTDLSGNGIPGVTVVCDQQKGSRWTTGPEGRVHIQLRPVVGNRRLTIRKEDDDDFETEQRVVRVLP